MNKRHTLILFVVALALSATQIPSIIQAQQLPEGASATSERAPGERQWWRMIATALPRGIH